MTIHLDTSALIVAIAEKGAGLDRLESWLATSERVTFSALVLYEWLRQAREEETHQLEQLFKHQVLVPFGPAEARIAADLYKVVARPRTREVDIAIAACAIVHNAALWTLNPRDFADIPGLRLV